MEQKHKSEFEEVLRKNLQSELSAEQMARQLGIDVDNFLAWKSHSEKQSTEALTGNEISLEEDK
ncbi:MAG TPA: hypothetical protein H9858_07115 [Candidatus Blautia stercoravium]|nr:hypothetical protein [Candidatus Blautia stercoravium]